MEEKDFYDYQYTDWDLDTIDLHFVSGRELMNLSLCHKLKLFYTLHLRNLKVYTSDILNLDYFIYQNLTFAIPKVYDFVLQRYRDKGV